MRRSKRNIASVYERGLEPYQYDKVNIHSSPPMKRLQTSSTIGSKPLDLIRDCFGQMIPHIWFILIPSEDKEYASVAFAMKQEWKMVS